MLSKKIGPDPDRPLNTQHLNLFTFYDNKKTVVLGASTNPARYAFMAAHQLKEKQIDFVPVGLKEGEVAGQKILDIRQRPFVANVDTVTLYIGPQNQKEWYDYVLSLKPKRIIFNPGAENPELSQLADQQGIETTEACTLVLLRTGQY